jgi:hypothetical protein
MATVGKSVQFRGIDNAVRAYENMAIPRWGLFQGTQFLMKYGGTSMSEGSELLSEYLNALDLRSADSNTYTLCIYDTAEKINSATKYDASFNFRLVDNIDAYNDNRLTGATAQRIAGIEEKLNALLADPEPEEVTPKDQLIGALSKILEVPQVQAALAQKLMGIIDGVGNTITGIFNQAQPLPARAAIGNVQKTTVEQENESLQQAINILAPVDPQLGTNLLKLAQIAQAAPEKYRLLITMLNTMK